MGKENLKQPKKEVPRPARFVKMFKRQFAEMVSAGKKLQTVRPTPTRMPKAGDVIDLREWTDKPYRSKQRKLGIGRILEVRVITITSERIEIEAWRGFRRMPNLDEFALRDGFESFKEMKGWFEKEHGLPFSGILIRWELVNEERHQDADMP